MKKEFEIYRSNFYGIIFLIASILSFIIGLLFIVTKIEWSGFLATIFFLLFAIFIGAFALFFLRPFVAATINKEKLIVYDKKINEIALDKIKKFEIKYHLMSLTVKVYAEEETHEFEWFVSKSYEVAVLLQDFLEKMGKEVVADENNIK
ncbi:MAG: hypothetical protein IJW54_02285 [Clostridia bacterium]|nr:hypothetical protein [Clostridia bacterium]